MTADQLVMDEDRGDYRDPAIRLSRLLGANSVVPLYESGDSCVLSVKGSIDGVKVLAYSTAARVMGGSMTAGGCRRIADAIRQARRTTVLLAEPGIFQPARSGFGPERDLRILLPESARRAYDVRPLVREILDHEDEDEPFLELQARWAPNLVAGLGRLCGGTVGVLANNPLRKGGCLDSLSDALQARLIEEHERTAGGVDRGHHGNIPL